MRKGNRINKLRAQTVTIAFGINKIALPDTELEALLKLRYTGFHAQTRRKKALVNNALTIKVLFGLQPTAECGVLLNKIRVFGEVEAGFIPGSYGLETKRGYGIRSVLPRTLIVVELRHCGEFEILVIDQVFEIVLKQAHASAQKCGIGFINGNIKQNPSA